MPPLEMQKSDTRSPGPLLFHCDALGVRNLARGLRTREEILRRHLDVIGELAQNHQIVMPTFNYDFCKTATYDIKRDVSQIGPISEAFRLGVAEWRTGVPVFNFAGTGAQSPRNIEEKSLHDPFGEDSVFGDIVRSNGGIIWYGAPLSSTTFLHYVERVAGEPPYRYDKDFVGTVLANGRVTVDSLTLRYHVWPRGIELRYDWERLEKDLYNDGIVEDINNAPGVRRSSATNLLAFWEEKLRANALYFLDSESSLWVRKKLDELGRRFELGDFEGENADY